jgi:hypothetical protein
MAWSVSGIEFFPGYPQQLYSPDRSDVQWHPGRIFYKSDSLRSTGEQSMNAESTRELADKIRKAGFVSIDNAYQLTDDEKLHIERLLGAPAMTAPDARLALADKVDRIAHMMKSLLSALPFCDPDVEDLQKAATALRASQPGTVSREAMDAEKLIKALRTAFRRFGGIPAIARSEAGAEKIISICVNEVLAILSLSIPANGREALESAETSFEFIRLRLIKHLEEPERSAFWTAVGSRDAVRAVLSALPVKEEWTPGCCKGLAPPEECACDGTVSPPPTHTGKMAAPVDAGAEQRAHLQDAERIPDADKTRLTTEELDVAQFGRSLHARPEPK